MAHVNDSSSKTPLIDLLPDLADPRSKYTAEKKLHAVSCYVVTGSAARAAKLAGLPASTIRKWKQEAPWWTEAVNTVKKSKQDELDGQMTGVIHGCLERLTAAIEAGTTYTNKHGEVKHTPTSARDLAAIFSQLHDKRAIQRGNLATNRSEEASHKQLEFIRREFERLSNDIDRKMGGTKIVSPAKVTVENEVNYNYATQKERESSTE